MQRRETNKTLSVNLTGILSAALARIAEAQGRPRFRQAEFFLEAVIEADRQEKTFRLRPEKPDFGDPSGEPWKILLTYEDFAHLEKRARESGLTNSRQAREWLWLGIEGYEHFDRGCSYRKEEFVRRLLERQEERRLAIR